MRGKQIFGLYFVFKKALNGYPFQQFFFANIITTNSKMNLSEALSDTEFRQ